MQRRKFIQTSIIGGITLYGIPALGSLMPGADGSAGVKPVDFELSLDVPTKLFDGKNCWATPRAGIIPNPADRNNPQVIMAMYKLDLTGNDIFTGVYCLGVDAPNKPWSEPAKNIPLDFRMQEIDGQQLHAGIASLWPGWHKASGKLLGIGSTVQYDANWKPGKVKYRRTCFAVYDAAKKDWKPWQTLEIPGVEDLLRSSAEGTQRYDEKDGTILIPVGYKPEKGNSGVCVIRCKFDGETLTYVEHGNFTRLDDETRGFSEPSVTKFKGKYYLTIRHDKTSFITTSKDGLNYEPIINWKFDDGGDLGTYNTQQHWVTHSDGLFLVYTRKGADNDNVYRNRAPLFMAQVDPDKLCVIRSTERILMPNKGARYGNFGITEISPNETWVTESEWMQPKGCEKYGSDGKVLAARIRWKKPNKLFTI